MRIAQFFAATFVLMGASAAIAETTYYFDYTTEIGSGEEGISGSVSVNGAVTVDTLGTVTTANVTDWNLMFSSSSFSETTTLTPANSTLDIETSLTATSMDLVMELSDPDDNNGVERSFRVFSQEVVSNLTRFGVQTGEGSPSLLYMEHTRNRTEIGDPRDMGNIHIGGPGPFTIASVPEPASIALLALGGVLLRRNARRG